METEHTYTAFIGDTRIASGPLETLIPAVKSRFDHNPGDLLLIFEDQSGRQVDFDLRGSLRDVLARARPAQPRTGPGRPKLGVISREISLLPRHWDWLEAQPSGASAAIRRLVDEARKREPDKERTRLAVDAAYRFMSAMGGNLPHYEEANRALYAGNRDRFQDVIREWPHDVRMHLLGMVREAFPSEVAIG